ncbi:MAG: Hsp20 family protein [Pikeienuella sp.]
MSRISLASHPYLLGFDQLDEMVERATRLSADGYPPYNIAQHGPDAYRITLAVAGFAPEDLAVTQEGAAVIVRGRRPADADGGEFLHRGIGRRPFHRSFVLAERMEVVAAHYENGVLSVDLKRRAAEEAVTRVEIATPATGKGAER